MLAQILPGLRELRGPLASGFLWMLLGWLLFHGSVSEAHGAIRQLTDLGAKLPASALGAAAGFLAYLIGSFSEDVFGRALNAAVRASSRVAPDAIPAYRPDMTDALLQAQITRLENRSDRLRAESDLRVAVLPPLVAFALYFAVTQDPWWALGLLLAPALAAQAWVRTRDYWVASQSLYELRRRVGIPPGSVREADSLQRASSNPGG